MSSTNATRLAICVYDRPTQTPLVMMLLNPYDTTPEEIAALYRDIDWSQDGRPATVEVVSLSVKFLSRGVTRAFQALEACKLTPIWELEASKACPESRISERFPVTLKTHPGRFSASLHDDHKGI